MESSDVPNTPSEPTDVTAAEPEPEPAAAPAEETVVVSIRHFQKKKNEVPFKSVLDTSDTFLNPPLPSSLPPGDPC